MNTADDEPGEARQSGNLEGKKSDPRFDFEPIRNYYGREWLKADLRGWPNGVAYSTLLHGDLVLKIAMTMFKDDANESQLFQKRLKTIEQILSTIEVSIGEIR